MSSAPRIEGYAIVSEDGMLANAAGTMPNSLNSAEIRHCSKKVSIMSMSWCMGTIPMNTCGARTCGTD